jgi:hypothetical protein
LSNKKPAALKQRVFISFSKVEGNISKKEAHRKRITNPESRFGKLTASEPRVTAIQRIS